VLGDVATARSVIERARAGAGEIQRLSVQTHAKAGLLDLLRGDLAAATSELEAGQRIGEIAPDELSYLKTLELRLRRAGGRPSFAEDAVRVTREGATAEVWALMLAATIDWQHARGALARADVEAAFAELESGKIPPLNLLELLAALADAGCLADGPRAAWRQRGRDLAARLRASLARHPRERAIFDRRHARWLTPAG